MTSGKSVGQTLSSALHAYVPITNWLPRYVRGWLKRDLLVGLLSWGTTVPTSMGYAQLAGLPVQAGLYASMVGLLVYGILGSSKQLKVGTSASMAVLSGAIVAFFAVGDEAYYIALSAALAIIVGLMLIALGAAKVSFISDFLAKPIIGGFLFGLAVIIIIARLPTLFGITVDGNSPLTQLLLLITSLDETILATLAVSVVSILILLSFWRFLPRFPGAIAILVLGILASAALDLEQYGVALVGRLPSGLPSITVPNVRLEDVLLLTVGALAVVLVALADSLGTARAFARENRYRIDLDQELLAIGFSNLGAGLFQGMAVGANTGITAGASGAKVRTQLASIVTALLIVATLLTQINLISYLPEAVLAIAVILSVTHMLNRAEFRREYRISKFDFILALVTLVGVLIAGILPGLIFAVILSLGMVLLRSGRPRVTVLGRLAGRSAFVEIGEHPDAEPLPGLLIVRPDVALYFANANSSLQEIRSLVARATEPPEVLVLVLGASNTLDISSTDMLATLFEELKEQGIRLAIANARSEARASMQLAGTIDLVGDQNLYLSVQEAVDAISSSSGPQ